MAKKLALVTLLVAVSTSAFCASPSDVVEGNPASPVRALIYGDLQSSDCAQLRLLLDQKILPRYEQRVAFIHRDLPMGKHDWARDAAVAGRWIYLRDHEAGITYRREIMAEQNNITLQNLKAWLLEFAARNHLDSKGIIDSLTDRNLIALVDQDRQSAVARGVTNAPAVYIGGVAITGTIIYEDVARALDEALTK